MRRALREAHDPRGRGGFAYVLTLGSSERDKARMHDLLVRNQEGALTPAEKEEMHAFGKAGDLLAILKAKARRTLGIKLKTGADA